MSSHGRFVTKSWGEWDDLAGVAQSEGRRGLASAIRVVISGYDSDCEENLDIFLDNEDADWVEKGLKDSNDRQKRQVNQ